MIVNPLIARWMKTGRCAEAVTRLTSEAYVHGPSTTSIGSGETLYETSSDLFMQHMHFNLTHLPRSLSCVESYLCRAHAQNKNVMPPYCQTISMLGSVHTSASFLTLLPRHTTGIFTCIRHTSTSQRSQRRLIASNSHLQVSE